jgi:hypothetical protein
MRRLIVAVASSLAMATTAVAQPAPAIGAPFVAGMIIVDRESAPGPGHGAFFTGDRFDGAVMGGVAGVGVNLWRHWSLRAEWHLTEALTLRETLPPAGPAEVEAARRFAAVAVQFGFPAGPAEEYLLSGRFDYQRRDRVGLALVGRRIGNRRIAVELLAGAGLISKREQADSVEVYASARTDTALPEHRRAWDFTKRQVTGVGGGDLTFRLTSRLHATAGGRIYRIQRGLSVRTGAGLRWTF